MENDKLAVGDQLMRQIVTFVEKAVPDDGAANDAAAELKEIQCGYRYAVITDLRCPCANREIVATNDQMASIVWLHLGRPLGGEHVHTLAELAQEGWVRSEHDEIGYWANIEGALKTGKLVGIGRGKR